MNAAAAAEARRVRTSRARAQERTRARERLERIPASVQALVARLTEDVLRPVEESLRAELSARGGAAANRHGANTAAVAATLADALPNVAHGSD